jgi:hypothetical protein
MLDKQRQSSTRTQVLRAVVVRANASTSRPKAVITAEEKPPTNG